jgi:hypothetical protein
MGKEQTSGYVSLNYIVNLVLMDINENTSVKRKKALQYAILGLTRLNLYTLDSIRTVYLTQNDNFTVDVPNDYIDYTKIGVVLDGQIITLSLNNDIPFPDKNKCAPVNNASKDDTVFNLFGSDYYFPDFGYSYLDYYRNGQYVGEQYGLGGGLGLFEFRYNPEDRQIAFTDKANNGEIILEYKSSGINKDGSSIVPREAVEPLRRWVHWQLDEYNDKIAQSAKTRRERLFLEAEADLRHFNFIFTIDEYMDNKYSVSKQTISR